MKPLFLVMLIVGFFSAAQAQSPQERTQYDEFYTVTEPMNLIESHDEASQDNTLEWIFSGNKCKALSKWAQEFTPFLLSIIIKSPTEMSLNLTIA